MEGIETGMGKTLRGKDGHRHQGEEEKDEGEIADKADAADVQVAHQREEGGGDQPVLDAGERAQFADVVGHEHAVGGAHEESAGPVPPAAVESPEVAEGGVGPAIKAALHRHSGGQFRGGQRDGNAEQKRNYQNEDEAEAGAGGGNHGLEAEGAAGAVSVKHGHEGREGDVLQFAMAWRRGRLRGHGHGKVEEVLLERQRKIKTGEGAKDDGYWFVIPKREPFACPACSASADKMHGSFAQTTLRTRRRQMIDVGMLELIWQLKRKVLRLARVSLRSIRARSG